MNNEFADKVVLITGAASGLGELLSRRLSQMGAKLVLGDRNEEGLYRVANELKAGGANVEAAKCDVIGLTKTAAAEYAKRGIRVNAICPFFTSTSMVTEGHVAGIQDFLAEATPMKWLERPGEVVQAMLMMCSPANSYMTGQAIAVDGGVTAM